MVIQLNVNLYYYYYYGGSTQLGEAVVSHILFVLGDGTEAGCVNFCEFVY